MKGLIIAVVVTGVLGGIVLNIPNRTEHVQESTEVEITAQPEVVEVDVIEKRIEEAKAEAVADIEVKANTARDQFIKNELDKVESQVLKEIQAELKARQVETDKRTGAYWGQVGNIRGLVVQTFPESSNVALAIAMAESGFNPRAYNPEWHYRNGQKICQGSFGIMQIACVHHIEDPTKLYDVEFNIKVARRVYDERGWRPWGAYTDGNYRQFLAMR